MFQWALTSSSSAGTWRLEVGHWCQVFAPPFCQSIVITFSMRLRRKSCTLTSRAPRILPLSELHGNSARVNCYNPSFFSETSFPKRTLD